MTTESAMIISFIVAAATTAGIITARRLAHGTDRTRSLLKQLFQDTETNADGTLEFRVADRQLRASLDTGTLTLSTTVPQPPLPWRVLARALGAGDVLALLTTSDITTNDDSVVLSLAASSLRTRAVRHAAQRLSQAADKLEALPFDAALARHLLDHATPAEQLATFTLLVDQHPHSPATVQCARTCATDPDHTALAAAAQSWLDRHVHATRPRHHAAG